MSIKRAILNAPFEVKQILEHNTIIVEVKYDGVYFIGEATCHSEDLNFYSDKVGTTIAHYRAMLEAMRYARDLAKSDYLAIKGAYYNAMYGKDKEILDPLKSFYYAVETARLRYERYRKYTKQLRNTLTKYLMNQDKVIESLKIQRSIGQNN